MAIRDALLARLRDPWFQIAAAVAFFLPAVWFVGGLFRGSGLPDKAYVVFAGPGPGVAGYFPILLLFLVASGASPRTRSEAWSAFVADVAMVAGAFALGWGVPTLVLAIMVGLDLSAVAAFLLVLLEATLLMAAWRALAGAVDRPGLDTGPLLRRLFALYAILLVVAPTLSIFTAPDPFDPTVGGVLSQLLTPSSTHRLLSDLTFPEVGYAGGAMARDAFGAWYSAGTVAVALLLWVAVPLAVMLRKFPRAQPPASPPGETPA